LQTGGEDHFEHDEQIALFVRLFVEGKTLISNGLNIIWLNNFPRLVLNSQLSAVQVSDHKVYTSESLEKSDFLSNKQVSTLSLELLVRLLLHNNHNVSWLHAWILVRFAMESVLLVVWRTFVNVCFQNLFLFDDLLAIASLALVLFVNHLALSATVFARPLRLRVHARSKHLHFGHHSVTLAG